MRLNKLLLSSLVSCLAMLSASAQDIHFTQYNMSPMTLNPANIGGFEGTVRVGGIYRSQWTSVLSSEQYETPSIWVDAPIIRGFRKNDWIGVGLMLFQDKVGAGSLVHSASKLGAAYHLALNKRGTTVLTLGMHYGQEAYTIRNAMGYQFAFGLRQGDQNKDDDYRALVQSTGNENPKTNFSDFDAGISLSSRINKTTDFRIGYAMSHLVEPRHGFPIGQGGGGPTPGPNPPPTGNQGQFKLPRRSIVTGIFNIKTSERLTISPSFVFQTMAQQDEIMVQGMAGYLFDQERDITLNAGLGYRLGDAINILVGARKKGLTVGVAYDVNTSGLSADTRNRGGFEIAANYIVKIYKKAVVKPKVICPRF